ncbi:MAG TPA: hypothetical protein VF017_00170 [Thermoanaerobaculia bacterium]|nr:hypothetical protein [Thermoanaerobaculia bacterium]
MSRLATYFRPAVVSGAFVVAFLVAAAFAPEPAQRTGASAPAEVQRSRLRLERLGPRPGRIVLEGLRNHPVALGELAGRPAPVLVEKAAPVAGTRELPVPERVARRLRAAALRTPPSAAIELQPGARPAEKAAGGFHSSYVADTIDASQATPNFRTTPPDPILAVGPDHVVVATNRAFAVYSKQDGALLAGPIWFAFFWADLGCFNLFDPNVLYDESADRFFVAADGAGLDYCVAASQTGDPTGDWNRYVIDVSEVDETDFFDYPQAGVGREGIFVAANVYRGVDLFDARVIAIDKDALYDGTPLTVVNESIWPNDTPHAMHLQGWRQGTWQEEGPHYFISNENYNGVTYALHAWTDPFDGSGGTLVKSGVVDLEAATGVPAAYPLDAPQLGGNPVQTNDWSPFDLDWRNGLLWTTNSIACNPGTGAVTCLRWAAIDPEDNEVVKAGVIGRADTWFSFPNVGVDHCGNFALGYTTHRADGYNSIEVTGRKRNDRHQNRPAFLCRAGEGTYVSYDRVPYRWGDYAEFAADPNGEDLWYVGEFTKINQTNPDFVLTKWGTALCHARFNSCRASDGDDDDDDDDDEDEDDPGDHHGDD